MTHGLHVYLGSGDLVDQQRTLRILRRCGASAAFVLIESIDGRRQPVTRVAKVCDALRGIDVVPVLYSFPNVVRGGRASRDHYATCRAATGAAGQLDAEPLGRDHHWTPTLLAPWLELDASLSITSTRSEAPRLGAHGRELWLQLESQRSTTTRFAETLRQFEGSPLVTGAFDEDGDVRTVAELAADLDRCTLRARAVGKHAVWSARSIDDAEADALREWAVATWAAAA